jgi:hypothetical protein
MGFADVERTRFWPFRGIAGEVLGLEGSIGGNNTVSKSQNPH